MSLPSTLSFIARHPNSDGRKLRNLARFAAWQMRCRLSDRPMPFEFVNGSKLYAARSLHGVTGNLYVGLHEFAEMGFALHFLRPGDLFCDVGANVGSYTILASAGIGSHVVSFEPDLSSCNWLKRNVALNKVQHLVTIHNKAAGASLGEVPFTTGRSTTNRIDPQGDTMVTVDTLDRTLPHVPSLIKIDVEGFEPDVLSGAAKALSSPNLQAVIAELHNPATATILKQQGFQLFSYDPLHRTLAANDSSSSENGIFVRDVDRVSSRLESAPHFVTLGRSI